MVKWLALVWWFPLTPYIMLYMTDTGEEIVGLLSEKKS